MTKNIDTLAFAISLSTTWTLLITALGTISTLTGQGTEAVELISTVYIGYEPTLIGILKGATWALIDGLMIGIIFATIYNKTQKTLKTRIYTEEE